jgi:hypothetical protein
MNDKNVRRFDHIVDLATAQAFIIERRRRGYGRGDVGGICVPVHVRERIARDGWLLRRAAGMPGDFPEEMLAGRIEVLGVEIIDGQGNFRLDEFSGKVGEKAERPTVKLSEARVRLIWDTLWREGGDWDAPPFPGIAALQESHPDGLIILGVKIEVVK